MINISWIQRVTAVITVLGLLTFPLYAVEKTATDVGVAVAPPYSAEQVSNRIPPAFVQPSEMNAINAEMFQPSVQGDEPPAQTPTETTGPPDIDPAQMMPNPPDTTTEPAGCSGPVDNSKCVTYSGDTRTIVYHEVLVLSASPTHGQTETADRNVFERWNYTDEIWETEWHTVDTDTHTWANADLDPISGNRSWEDSHRYRHEAFYGDNANPNYAWEQGYVNMVVTDPNGRTIEEVHYSYTEPPLSRNGYRATVKYNAIGLVIETVMTTYTGHSESKIKQTDSDSDGILDTCNETVTEDGKVTYQGPCEGLWA